MKNPVYFLLASTLLFALTLAGCGSGSNGSSGSSDPGVLQSISISQMTTPILGIFSVTPVPQPGDHVLSFNGLPNQFYVNGFYSNLEGLQDITSSCTWSSSNQAVGAVDANGKFTLHGNGTTTVTASYNGKSAAVSIYTKSIDYADASGHNYSFYWYGTLPVNYISLTHDSNGKVNGSFAAYTNPTN